jgi:hypothetical protein
MLADFFPKSQNNLPESLVKKTQAVIKYFIFGARRS